MNFKKQAIVAAAILAVAGAANAKLSTEYSENGSSLAMIAVDATAKKSVVVDLGLNFADFLPQGTNGNVQIPGDGTVASGFNTNVANAWTYAAGTTLSWNLNTNTFSVNGVAQAAVNGKAIDWSQFSTFTAATTMSNTKWGVIAGSYNNINTDPALDINGYGALGPYGQIITTGPLSGVTVDATTIIGAAGKVQNLFVNNGASVPTSGNDNPLTNGADVRGLGQAGYVGNDNEFGLAGAWGNQLAFSALANVNTAQSMYWTNEISPDWQGLNGSVDSTVVKYAGQFAFNGNTLTYTVPGNTAPVPEPESFALVIAALAAIGAVARRRA